MGRISMSNEWANLFSNPNKTGINPECEKDFLAGIQGNILNSHGKAYVKYVFLVFDPEKLSDTLNWITHFRPTSAWDLHLERQRDGEQPIIYRGLSLSKLGYDALGIPCEHQPADPLFRSGVNAKFWKSMNVLNGHQIDSAHCLVAIAADQKTIQNEETWRRHLAGDWEGDVLAIATDIHTEDGHVLWQDLDGNYGAGVRKCKKTQFPVEHFGYRDNISNPQFFKPSATKWARGDDELDDEYGTWSDAAPLSLALTDEATSAPDVRNGYGSYVAFLKISQDVDGFTAGIRELAKKLSDAEGRPFDKESIQDAEARVVGRYRDGTPAIAKGSGKRTANDFDYGTKDPDGRQCPFFAHVRRANPRGELAKQHARNPDVRAGDPRNSSPEAERSFRIVRRGIPYGEIHKAAWDDRYNDRTPDYDPRGSRLRGLLFMSFQASLSQFETMLSGGMDRNFYGFDDKRTLGADPISAHIEHNRPWPVGTNPDKVEFMKFKQYVHHEYGAYFFAPSLDWLRQIEQISVTG